MARPTILLVEDRENIRTELARQFYKGGASVIAAANANEAWATFQKRTSEVAALVTDIRLNDDDPQDRGGVFLAQKISDITPRLPCIGVTAFDAGVGGGILEQVYQKTTMKSPNTRSIYNNIDNIVARASQYDETRFDGMPSELILLKEKYGISSLDFSVLISNLRLKDLSQLALLTWHESQVDDQVVEFDREEEVNERENLKEATKNIRLVTRGTPIDNLHNTQKDFAVVTREISDGVIAQLYGMPLVFTYADNEEDAVGALVEYLFDCHQNMGEPHDFSGSNIVDVVRFKNFLKEIFPSEDHGHGL